MFSEFSAIYFDYIPQQAQLCPNRISNFYLPLCHLLKSSLNSIYFVHALLNVWPSTGIWLIFQEWDFVSTFSQYAGILSGLILWGSCAWYNNCYDFISKINLLCLEKLFPCSHLKPLVLRIFLPPFPPSVTLESQEEYIQWISHVRLFSEGPWSLHFDQLCFCVNQHLPHIEASLMRVRRWH